MENINLLATELILSSSPNANNNITSNETINYETENRTCMHGLIRQTRHCLEEFTNPDLSKIHQIPFQILNEAKGIVFLTILKGAFGVGGTIGTGIIIVRDKEESHRWNGPIAISLNGLQLGLNVGIQQSDHIIILRDDKDIEKFASGQFRFEGDASIALGTIGHDSNIALSVNEKGYMPSASYSLTKGAYIGISMESQAIVLQNECNDEYFGTKTNPMDVFKGTMKSVQVDEEYNNLCQLLNDYIFKQKSDFLSTFIKDEIHTNEKDNVTVTSNDKEIITKIDNNLEQNTNNQIDTVENK